MTARSVDTALGLDSKLTDAQLTEYLDQVFRAVLEGSPANGKGTSRRRSNDDRAGGPLVVRPGTQLRPAGQPSRKSIDNRTGWCHTGTMKRMNLRDVPDDVYEALAEAAQANRQSLSAFVVERLTEVARVARLDDYIASYQPPAGSGVTLEGAAAAVREVREAS